jgi:hypothetical protein
MASPDRIAEARERLAARSRRIRLIRRRIVAGTLATFVLAWGVVMFDGAMGTTSTTAATQVAAAETATSSSSDTDTSSTSTDDTTASDDDSAATMTTSQS